MPYLDTSILGAYYCIETTSTAVIQDLRSVKAAVISNYVELEFASLLSLKVRNGELDHPSASAVHRLFQRHLGDHLYSALSPDDLDLQTAKRWLSRFDTPLRTLDALHLSMAINRRLKLWTTDKALARAARKLRVPHHLITA